MVFGWLACLAQTLLGSFLVEQSAMEQVLIHNESCKTALYSRCTNDKS